MGQTDLAAEFLELYLPPAISVLLDFSQLETVKDSFVSNELQEYFSDLLFRVQLKNGATAYVYILLEHKSAPDKAVAFQLLGYIPPILEKVRGKSDKLPLILPVVFYHGRSRWNIAENLGAMFDFSGDLAAFRDYVPEFRYHLCDLSRYADEDLTGRPHLQAVLRVLKHAFQADLNQQLEEIFRSLLSSGLPTSRIADLLKVIVYYLRHGVKLDKDQMAQAFTAVARAQGEYIMFDPAELTDTFIDRWILAGLEKGDKQGHQRGLAEGLQVGLQTGLQHGVQTGLQQGLLKAIRQILQSNLGKKLPARTETQLQRLSVAQLEDLLVASAKLEKPKDLADWFKEQEAPETIH